MEEEEIKEAISTLESAQEELSISEQKEVQTLDKSVAILDVYFTDE
jgi:hypothetical protein